MAALQCLLSRCNFRRLTFGPAQSSPSRMIQFQYAQDNIAAAAKRLLNAAADLRVWTFSGPLGAGKTTLVSALCRRLGITDAVSSPTFALINEYALPAGTGPYQSLLHMDWYRVAGAEEALQSGLEDALYRSDARVWLEWPARAPELLQGLPHAELVLEVLDEQERLVTVIRRETFPA